MVEDFDSNPYGISPPLWPSTFQGHTCTCSIGWSTKIEYRWGYGRYWTLCFKWHRIRLYRFLPHRIIFVPYYWSAWWGMKYPYIQVCLIIRFCRDGPKSLVIGGKECIYLLLRMFRSALRSSPQMHRNRGRYCARSIFCCRHGPDE